MSSDVGGVVGCNLLSLITTTNISYRSFLGRGIIDKISCSCLRAGANVRATIGNICSAVH